MQSVRSLLAAVLAVCFAASAAWAGPDAEGSATISEPNGAFSAIKAFKVYADTNPDNPAPVAGQFTYIYTITNQASSLICLTGFDLEVPAGSVSSAGFLPGAGVAPSATSVGAGVVEWDFNAPNICPGQVSEDLFLRSPYAPGDADDNVVSIDGQFALSAPGTCVGPVVAPPPLPCTIGFWKNRADGKKGLLQFFPDPEFDQVVAAAVALSNGIFPNATALLNDLGSTGNRPMDQRARQQLAATLLNLAAGDLFPSNQKCKLFETNPISANMCGTGISVGTAVNGPGGIFADYAGGLFEDAKNCSDDINNGVGLN